MLKTLSFATLGIKYTCDCCKPSPGISLTNTINVADSANLDRLH